MHFIRMGLQVVTQIRYLCGCIIDQDPEKVLLSDKETRWTDLVEMLAGVEHQHLQTIYAGLQNSLLQY